MAKEKLTVTVVTPKAKKVNAEMLPVAKETFKNPIFAKHMETIRNAQGKGREQAWTIANHYVQIVESECFKDDFVDQKAFCAYEGISPSSLSKYKKAMNFRRKYLAEVKANAYTVSRASILMGLGDKKDDFMSWLKSTKQTIKSDRNLEDLIEKYRKKDVIDITPDDEDDEDDEIIETEDKAITPKTLTKAGGDKFCTFDYEGKTYEIPLKALAKYEKKAEKQEEQEG